MGEETATDSRTPKGEAVIDVKGTLGSRVGSLRCHSPTLPPSPSPLLPSHAASSPTLPPLPRCPLSLLLPSHAAPSPSSFSF
ncbi:hypothetical protein Pmani_028954 [Petrolisthes manimaculis]|uniref:Uncharacterized protein n=1 Tax=Petrolisthes manimaculis TaxID=1843537 RepID=A0AAE1P171_9EUCA|nr:hypothetical protein Pmani_028954 [Petrolisthes manimaculis]